MTQKTIKTLKITCLISTLMLCSLAFTACDPDNYQHPDVLQGHWVLTNTKDGVLALDFVDDELFVTDATHEHAPFNSSTEWTWYMTKDSVLVISYDDYDYYDKSTSSYELDLSFSDHYHYLTLVYDPWLGHTKSYTFYKRAE